MGNERKGGKIEKNTIEIVYIEMIGFNNFIIFCVFVS